ncbi:hypothetical protein BU24DRAFT_40737 [Aaosphaeria arxii CBS 175.79]|uniref:Uncharacterized protein n=1 Tax=Aaosphaeria arxii CBS 175.79 TaxID=1450172 RepID=A0A6A5Y9J4_9PLEO|nr:uncharacterized protein BU24DRAFT_40737 [Aaosphaeria arxii CBS 175.79]KAF2022252.1 hypothetical protein BU24DRAFT_40737 [Aaosphaeria arxii CBS 175.79]
MSSRTSYSSSSTHDKGAYGQRSSSPRSTICTASPNTPFNHLQTTNIPPAYTCSSSASSIYANSASSTSRGSRYGNKPPVIHNGGGPSNDPNTSTSAGNAGYYQ